MTIPIAGSASPWMWLPFIAYFVAVGAALFAVIRERGSAAGDVSPEEDRQPDHQ